MKHGDLAGALSISYCMFEGLQLADRVALDIDGFVSIWNYAITSRLGMLALGRIHFYHGQAHITTPGRTAMKFTIDTQFKHASFASPASVSFQ